MKIAVAGGTGVVGAHVVAAGLERGHDIVAMSRASGVDLRTGEGLPAALEGVEVVIDVSNVTTTSADESVEYFTTATRTLLAAEAAAGIGHHVALSIVGIDGAPDGYYAGKLAQEELVVAGDIPWTIQRATQFHEFALQMYARAKVGPFHVAPRARTQPVAAQEVAERLLELAVAHPAGRAADLGGPREESLADMVRAYARATGSRAWIPPVSLPGAFGRAMRDGSLLPGPGAVLGRQTFAEWIGTIRL